MAVQPQTPHKEYTANGSTNSFALEFDCDNQDHLIVLVGDIEPVVGAWSLIGGAVVFGTAPTNGKKITIQRNTPFRRDGDFQSYDNSFRPGPVNKGFDWVWLKLQELGVADWILSNRIDALKAYVDKQDNTLQKNIDNLKGYVDDRDDELRAYLLEEIRKQGVALDQLDDYYNYLMQMLAQIAVDRGWSASFVSDASGLNQQQINDEVVSIFRFGAKCDGTLHKCQEWLDSGRFNSFAQLQNAYPSAVSVDDSIDTLAMEKALAKIGAYGHVRLGGKPVFNRTVKFNQYARGVRVFANNLCTVEFKHGGDGFLIEGYSDVVGANYGQNSLDNIDVFGGDPLYPAAGYVRKNTGSGINIVNGYYSNLNNVTSRGFKNGIRIRQGFQNNCTGACAFYGNEKGVFIDGAASNLNNFKGARIRLNWVGVHIDGFNKGYGYYPTRNFFNGAYIETNLKYEGAYLPNPGDGSYGVGVKLSQTYYNDFSGVYFEGQEFDVWLENSSSYNKFIATRHGAGGLADRACKIMLKGANVNSNIFAFSDYIKDGTITSSLVSDNANQFDNKFIDCTGFIFDQTQILCYDNLTIRGMAKNGINGDAFGAMTREATAYATAGGGTGVGSVDGIGTTSAVLNAKGLGEVALGNSITAPTTITTITGLRKGQIFILKNYQPNHPVTIKASVDGINGLVLNGRRDCVLAAYSDSITFFVSGLGKIVEIGRTVQTGASPVEQSVGTWTPVVKSSGGSTIATSSATGRWVKNGRQLTVWFDITASVDLTEPNYYTVTGMPNLPQFASNGAGQVSSATNATNANQKDVFAVDATTSELRVRVSTQANFSNSDSFSGCVTYIIT